VILLRILSHEIAISFNFVSRLRFSALRSKYRGDVLNGEDNELIGFAGVDEVSDERAEDEDEDDVEVVWNEAASSLTECSLSVRIKPFLIDDDSSLWQPFTLKFSDLLLLDLCSIVCNIWLGWFQYSLLWILLFLGLWFNSSNKASPSVFEYFLPGLGAKSNLLFSITWLELL